MSAGETEMAVSHGRLMELLYGMCGAETEDHQSKIRSRFKSLQKAGMPSGIKPKRGTRDKYSFEQVCEVIMAFEFAQIGVDANSIVQFYPKFMETSRALHRYTDTLMHKKRAAGPTVWFHQQLILKKPPAISVHLGSFALPSDQRKGMDLESTNLCFLNIGTIGDDMLRLLQKLDVKP